MVREVRNLVLENEGALVEILNSAGVSSDKAVDDLLDQSSEEETHAHLAAVLWARGLADPSERELFRLLPALMDDGHASHQSRRDRKRESTETRGDPRIAKAMKRIAELEEDLKSTQKRLRKRAAATKTVERERDRLQSKADDLASRTQEAEALAQQEQTDIEALRAELVELKQQLASATNSAQTLRKELDRQTEALASRDQERRRLTADLARARQDNDALGAQLRGVPRGKEAVAEFVAAEKERIALERDSTEGADKARAEEEHTKRRKLERAFREAYPEYVPPRPVDPLATERSSSLRWAEGPRWGAVLIS